MSYTRPVTLPKGRYRLVKSVHPPFDRQGIQPLVQLSAEFIARRRALTGRLRHVSGGAAGTQHSELNAALTCELNACQRPAYGPVHGVGGRAAAGRAKRAPRR
jgi:hypothetical protein